MSTRLLCVPALLGAVVSGAVANADPVITLSSPSLITSSGSTQLDPAIDGDIVVYTDFRNGNEDIYYHDLSTGTETQLSSSVLNQRLNDVGGNRIVYTDLVAPGPKIMLYDIATGVSSTVTTSPYHQNPRIDGDIVVFERGFTGATDVVARDLVSGTEYLVAATAGPEFSPVVDRRRVVYERRASPNDPSEIVLFDLDSQTEVVLGAAQYDARRPDIDGDLVVWDVTDAGNNETDIAVHDLETGTTEVIALPGNQRAAHVSGRYVIFDDESSGTWDTRLYHVDSGQLVGVGTGPAVQFLNDISGQRIAYTTNESGNFDIAVVEFDAAPRLGITPATGLEYGTVNVGASQSQIVTLSHWRNVEVTVTGLTLLAGGAPGFSVGPASPSTLPVGGSADIPVTFAPVSAGPALATLRITTTAGSIDVPLSGAGAVVAPPPHQVIADILAFFDATVGAGTLQGAGNGNSAAGRRDALRNMIEAAGDLLQQGRTADACQQLGDALDRTDGAPQPPDFVAGTASAELAQRIRALRTSLGCTG